MVLFIVHVEWSLVPLRFMSVGCCLLVVRDGYIVVIRAWLLVVGCCSFW